MGDVWRGLEVVEAATRVGSDMLVRIKIEYYNVHLSVHAHDVCICICARLFSHIQSRGCKYVINMTVLILQGDSLQNLSSGLDTVSYRVPLGVCAGIGKYSCFQTHIPQIIRSR